MRALFAALVLVLSTTAVAHATDPVAAGTRFPLASDGAVPTLMRIEVHHVQADNTVDVQVWLNAPAKLPASMEGLSIQVGEFCVRYYETIVAAVVAAPERSRVYVFAPLYTIPTPGDPKKFEQVGFAFKQIGGKCSLAPPFPAQLVPTVMDRAKEPVAN